MLHFLFLSGKDRIQHQSMFNALFFYAGKKMQNLLDLVNRCFINAISQSWVVDLVNLSFRNM